MARVRTGLNKSGDIIRFGPNNRPHRIEKVLGGGKVVVLQEMARDSLGRLRSTGEEGRFSTTRAALHSPLLRRTRKK